MSRSAPPVYDFELSFYQALAIRWETGRRYRRLGVLKADAKTSSGRPLFLAKCPNHRKGQGRDRDPSGKPNPSPVKPSGVKPCCSQRFLARHGVSVAPVEARVSTVRRLSLIFE